MGLLRAALLCLLVLGAVVPAVRAEVRVVDAETGAERILFRGETFLDGWSNDGTVLEIGTRRRGRFRVGLDGRRTPAPDLVGVRDTGPHGWQLRTTHPRIDDGKYELRAPDGRLVHAFRFDNRIDTASIAWARDGSPRVASRHPELYDTNAGEQIAGELDRWLKAAGLEPIEARDELAC